MSEPIGGIGLELIGDDAGVQAMLLHLDTALNPTAMAGFLGVKVGVYLKERAAKRFGNEGDDVSGPWAPLAPSTQLVRANGDWAVGPDHPINRRTGELEAYITQSDILAGMFGYGSSVTYPGKLGTGKSLRQKVSTAQQGRSKPSTVPRPVLGINENDALFILTELAFYVEKGRV